MNRPDEKCRKWKRKVIERCGKKCVRCGRTRGLQAHHLLPWATHPETRFIVSNGVALCSRCHHVVHRHGGYIPPLEWDGRVPEVNA